MQNVKIDALYEKIQDLERQNKIQNEIFENLYDGLYITDGNGYTLYVNKAYLKITGLNKADLIGFHMDELIDRGYFKEAVSLDIIKSGKPKSLIDVFQNGKQCLITGSPIFNENGDVNRVVTSIRDMTDLLDLQKTLEETRELNVKYENELLYLRNENMGNSDVVGQSKKFKDLMDLVYRVAETDATVLITGETGTGKELVAREIHRRSKRVNQSFIKVNCAAIPENLLESELFGYEKGAFTGATKTKLGMFELANEGTILLDEIGEMNIALQSKLLRVVQNRELTRLGGVDTISVDVRLIASTNKDLKALVNSGKFREDLYYRLNVIPIKTPPLRERKEDIAFLVKYFLSKFNEIYSVSKSFSREAVEVLSSYTWPGNIRELENLLERLVITCNEDMIEYDSLLNYIDIERNGMIDSILKRDGSFNEKVEALEKRMLCDAADKYHSTREMAKYLEISQPTVVRKMNKYDIKTTK